MLIRRHCGIQLCAADIEIEPDGRGRPTAKGAWVQRLGISPVVSIAHSGNRAAALAALSSNHWVGIDLEQVSRRSDSFVSEAFTEEERLLLSTVPCDREEEWLLRLWCAKEALVKALGYGLSEGLHSVEVAELDVESGFVKMYLRNGLLERFPQMRNKAVQAYTGREIEFIFSGVIYRSGVLN
jgi:phosphopantetheine--protein transferase-like protein